MPEMSEAIRRGLRDLKEGLDSVDSKMLGSCWLSDLEVVLFSRMYMRIETKSLRHSESTTAVEVR